MLAQKIMLAALLMPIALGASDQKHVSQGLQPTPTSPTSGQQMFRAYCADCHGDQGKGNGPLVSILKMAPPDLTSLSKRNSGKFPYDRVYQTIVGESQSAAHGSREMPIWGPVFRSMGKGRKDETKLRMQTLTSYIASLQK